MLELFEIKPNGERISISNLNGIYNVYELGFYELELNLNVVEKLDSLIFLEDYELSSDNYFIDSNKLTFKKKQYFIDSFGLSVLHVYGYKFTFNILCDKIKAEEIENILIYLYEKSESKIQGLLSRSSYKLAKSQQGSEMGFTSKYVRFISSFCNTFEILFKYFLNSPHTLVRKNSAIENYSSASIDSESLNWLLQNLDSISFENNLVPLSDTSENCVQINENIIGYVSNISSVKTINSFNNYENKIILGSFKFAIKVINSLIQEIDLKLTYSIQTSNFKYSDKYIDFRDFKILPYVKIKSDLQKELKRLTHLFYLYKEMFIGCDIKIEKPILTSIFLKKSHYLKAYSAIINLYSQLYSFSDDSFLLNINKLSTLYEIFNLHFIIDRLDSILQSKNYIKDVYYLSDQSEINSVSYTNETINNNLIIKLYYQPKIFTYKDKLNLIVLNYVGANSSFYTPDFVVEINDNSNFTYFVIDSKYSRLETIRNNHLKKCIQSYIVDIAYADDFYKKPEWLIILHPDKSDNNISNLSDMKHFPKILTVNVLPSNKDHLDYLFNEILKKV